VVSVAKEFFTRASCKHTAKPVLQEWLAWPPGVEDRPTCFSLQQGNSPTAVAGGTIVEVTGWTSVSRGYTSREGLVPH